MIAALVHNEAGVLAGVSNMFAARGYNIDSLVVGRTEFDALSRCSSIALNDSFRAAFVSNLGSLRLLSCDIYDVSQDHHHSR